MERDACLDSLKSLESTVLKKKQKIGSFFETSVQATQKSEFSFSCLDKAQLKFDWDVCSLQAEQHYGGLGLRCDNAVKCVQLVINEAKHFFFLKEM